MTSEWRNYHFKFKNREMSDDKPPTSHSHVSMHCVSLQALMFEALGTSIMHKINEVLDFLFAFAFCFAKTATARTQAGLIHCVAKMLFLLLAFSLFVQLSCVYFLWDVYLFFFQLIGLTHIHWYLKISWWPDPTQPAPSCNPTSKGRALLLVPLVSPWP